MKTLYIQGDIFKIDNKEYRLRFINEHNNCWLEPVLKRDKDFCATGGLNKIIHRSCLSELEYMNACY